MFLLKCFESQGVERKFTSQSIDSLYFGVRFCNRSLDYVCF